MFFVDAHVHLHGCFSPQRFLDAAAANFEQAAAHLGLPPHTPGMLLFTQTTDRDAFGGLRPGALGRWRLSATAESISLAAERAEAPLLILTAGRQIATAEGLELLALGAAGPFEDGQPIDHTIDEVRRRGGLPVLPWGFGKWWFGRGRVVRRIIHDRQRFPLLFLGDNAGRPTIAPRPSLLTEGEHRCRSVLPGTDPLPLPAEEAKVGRLAFCMQHTLDKERPFEGLKQALTAHQISPPVVGHHERTLDFLHRQIALRLCRSP
ncbi:hypothetical protein V5738_17155 [Salinisphaera sp. SPP-AMP-43]|uniref:hypothetical protein n=1 Tax=Salinisphaera sp. SPP-AMP-43 TaxID=3121288 RepID=UPI003C6E42F5